MTSDDRWTTELWSKTENDGPLYPLECHLLDAMCAMGTVWDDWLRPGLRELLVEELGPDAPKIALLCAGLHDIGKANPVFTLQLASDKKHPWRASLTERLRELNYPDTSQIRANEYRKPILRRHEQVGAMHLAGGKIRNNQPAASMLTSLTTLGHHGTFLRDMPDQQLYRKHACGQWKSTRDLLVEIVEQASGFKVGDIPSTVSPVVTILLSGMVVLADRLASHKSAVENAFEGIRTKELSPSRPEEWLQLRRPYLENLLQQTVGIYEDFSDAKSEILGDLNLREVQARASNSGGGLWIAMAPTGSGKTEAAWLRHAQSPESLTFLLHTQAATTAAMRRTQIAYKQTSNIATLAHGKSSLDPFYWRPITDGPETEASQVSMGLFPTEFVRQRSARLLAPVVVGTVDQALMGVLALKWTHLRLLALANSHVVVDEAHTLDAYQSRLLESLLYWLGETRTRVTILTATLPTQSLNAFVNAYTHNTATVDGKAVFPSTLHIPSPKAEGNIHCPNPLPMSPYKIGIHLTETRDSTREHIAWGKAKAEQFPNARIGIFVNRIRRAQDIGTALKSLGFNVLVLHSQMSAEHRRVVEEKLDKLLGKTSEGKGLIVVGTQTIEASLDLDFDIASSDLAPGASLIQRAGRVWRRSDPTRADRIPEITELPLNIVRDTSEASHYPYFASALNRVWSFLKDRDAIAVPGDVQDLVETGSLTLEQVTSEEDFEEIAEISRKGQRGLSTAINMQFVLSPDLRFSDFEQLTLDANSPSQNSDDVPRTRLIENETRNVIIINSDQSLIPGAWTGTAKDLEHIDYHDAETTRHALNAAIPVSNRRLLKRLSETMTALEQGPALLQGALTGPLPPGVHYDPLVGLMEDI